MERRLCRLIPPVVEHPDLYRSWPNVGVKLPTMIWIVVLWLQQCNDQLKIEWTYEPQICLQWLTIKCFKQIHQITSRKSQPKNHLDYDGFKRKTLRGWLGVFYPWDKNLKQVGNQKIKFIQRDKRKMSFIRIGNIKELASKQMVKLEATNLSRHSIDKNQVAAKNEYSQKHPRKKTIKVKTTCVNNCHLEQGAYVTTFANQNSNLN